MTQASNRRQEEAKEGWVKAGPRVSTQERSEGIISHTGETPSWWFVSTLQVRSSPLVFLSPLLFRYWPLVQVKLRQFSQQCPVILQLQQPPLLVHDLRL